MEKPIRINIIEGLETLDFEYWRKTTPEERLDAVQHLREMVSGLKSEKERRIKKVIKIIKLKKFSS
ncbi:MAG: hypothetical protein NTZ12_01080 [Candidatus Aminicenantes bacterium]|nr:hypothetical protein [Candidatus Aminicenantes bacterium]